VLKRSAGDDLLQAILTVSAGGIHFEPSLAGQLLAREAGVAHPRTEAHSAALSVREKEVLLLLAWGYSNKEIAHNLRLSVKTVETYKVRVAEKLGLRSRTEIVQFALRQGWLNETQAPK
ncbi:MAG: response regulator transcription factor, partial [Limisphaerales bacterium]